jgi:heme O synthase-like polyprenyltransferase
MRAMIPVRALSRTTNNCLQAYMLLLLVVSFLAVAKLGILNSYSLGEFLVLGLIHLATSARK